MPSIDVGPGATNRATDTITTYTYIDLANIANATGKVTSIELWFNSDATGVSVGTFSVNGGDPTKYTNRASASIGNVTAGAKRTYNAPGDFTEFDVSTGDYLGVYMATGTIECDTVGGSGLYFKAGNQMGTGEQTYTNIAGCAVSIYATGSLRLTQVAGGTFSAAKIVGTLAKDMVFPQIVSGVITPIGALAKTVATKIGGVIHPVGAIRQSISTKIGGVVTSAGSVKQQIAIKIGGTVTSAGTLARAWLVSVGGSITPVGGAVAGWMTNFVLKLKASAYRRLEMTATKYREIKQTAERYRRLINREK